MTEYLFFKAANKRKERRKRLKIRIYGGFEKSCSIIRKNLWKTITKK